MPKMKAHERERVKTVVTQLYLQNIRDITAIREYLREKEGFTISQPQVYRYLEVSKAEMKRSAAFDREEEIGKAKAQLEDLFRKCVTAKKYQTALGVRRELSETIGIKAPAEMKHTGLTLEDWMIAEAEKMKAADSGSKPSGRSDAPAVPEPYH